MFVVRRCADFRERNIIFENENILYYNDNREETEFLFVQATCTVEYSMSAASEDMWISLNPSPCEVVDSVDRAHLSNGSKTYEEYLTKCTQCKPSLCFGLLGTRNLLRVWLRGTKYYDIDGNRVQDIDFRRGATVHLLLQPLQCARQQRLQWLVRQLKSKETYHHVSPVEDLDLTECTLDDNIELIKVSDILRK